MSQKIEGMIERCSPVEMRKNLQVVEQFKQLGIDFVAIPVRDNDHKKALVALSIEVLEELATTDLKEKL